MGSDFDELMAAIEAEAAAAGPEGVARLIEARTRYRLANQLITLRRERGWTQDKLATLTGIRQSEISRIERAVIAPSETTWARIAAAFGYELALVPVGQTAP